MGGGLAVQRILFVQKGGARRQLVCGMRSVHCSFPLSPRALLFLSFSLSFTHTHTNARVPSIQPRRLTAFLYTLLPNAVVWPQFVPVCCIVIASMSPRSSPISPNKTADCVLYKALQVRDLSAFLTWQRGLVKSIFIIIYYYLKKKKAFLSFKFKHFD